MTEPIPGSLKAAFAAVLAALVAGVLLAGGTESSRGPLFTGSTQAFEPAVVEPVPYDGRSPAPTAGPRERVLVELPRPALAGRGDAASMSPAAQRAYVASLRDEARALVSALAARGVRARDVVTYERAWHGFAATVDADDLPGLVGMGLRVRPNRRLFPAVSEPVRVGDPTGVAPPPDAPAVTLLGGGARTGGPAGHDAVGRDREPLPAAGEDGGQPLADELARLGIVARVVRVSGLRRVSTLAAPEEYGRTDEFLDGLERVVDPDGDGDTSDHDSVALVAVNAPYAGFEEAPEVRAVAGAVRLGTLVVAPVGHEGRAAGAFGTVGAPGAAADALTVAPLSDPQAVARTTLRVGGLSIDGAAVLGGGPPTGELRTGEQVAVVRAGDNPAAGAAEAADGGSSAVLLAEPREDRPLPAMPAGRLPVPVLGVTGAAAAAVLELDPGEPVRVEGIEAAMGGEPRPSPSASTGPAFGGAAKPELQRPGSTIAGGRLVSGAAVAAAAVAAEAARLGEPDPARARARLVETPAAAEPPAAPDVPVGTLEVRRDDGRTGVAFTLGRFERGDPLAGTGTEIVPAATLELVLARESGGVVERLTPPGGERGLLPGEYAYTLRRAVVDRLEAGSYVFRVRARAPRQQRPTVASSPPFEAG